MVFTVAIKVAGVVCAETDALSQLGAATSVNCSAELPVRLMDWLAGLEPPAGALKVRLDGLTARLGCLETTSETGINNGELTAVELLTEMDAV